MIRFLPIIAATIHFSFGETLTRVENTTLNLPATVPDEGGYALENAFGTLGFNHPIAMAIAPGDSNHIYVVERRGTVQRVNLATNTKSTFLDLNPFYSTISNNSLIWSGENGLLSMAFHPDYNNNGRVFLFYTTRSSSGQYHGHIAEIQASGTPGNYLNTASISDSRLGSTHQNLITQYDQSSNHNGGDLTFGNDGYLYISTGDEGSRDNLYDNAGYIDKDFFAAILRIDVDSKAGSLTPNAHNQSGSSLFSSAVHSGTYKVPNDNPFIGATVHRGKVITASSLRTEIWSTGHRNPFRMGYDAPTGRLFVGDVGQDNYEEIDILSGGEDCGWPHWDGPLAWPSGISSVAVPVSPHMPQHSYSTGSSPNQGDTIIAGRVYRGSRLSELAETFIFGDYISGNVWSLKEDPVGTWTPTNLIDRSNLTSFEIDPQNGDLLTTYIGNSLGYGHSSNTGFVYRLVRGSSSNPAPALLSETGAFSNLTNLTPNAGIYKYDANLPFWSDHAIKTRWFSVPDISNKMTFAEDSPWSFPGGTVWIKHFEIETERGNPATARKLETRFIVKTAANAYGLTYRWRPDQSEADLVASAGLSESLSITVDGSPTTQEWRYPSRSQCLQCHKASNNYTLSFNTRQLNRDGALGVDQIDQLSCAGFLSNTPTDSRFLHAHPDLTDTTISTEARARAYIDVNCSFCHFGGGWFDGRASTPTDDTEIINGSLNTYPSPSHRVIVPGSESHSYLLQRIDGTAGRMPPIASSELDPQGIDLIKDWIAALPDRESYDQWAATALSGISENGRSEDPDHDGQDNETEYLAGSDPTNGADRAELELGSSSVSFFQPANRHVLIEMSNDLSDWFVLPDPNNILTPAASSSTQTLDTPTGEERLFLRMEISQP